MITKIGENAGLVWGALQNGAQGLKALKKAGITPEMLKNKIPENQNIAPTNTNTGPAMHMFDGDKPGPRSCRRAGRRGWAAGR